MCKIGDIIGIPRPIGEDGTIIGFHYYIVISDERGKIQGFDFDKIASVMSSFHIERIKEMDSKGKLKININNIREKQLTY